MQNGAYETKIKVFVELHSSCRLQWTFFSFFTISFRLLEAAHISLLVIPSSVGKAGSQASSTLSLLPLSYLLLTLTLQLPSFKEFVTILGPSDNPG